MDLFTTALDREYTDFLGSCRHLLMTMRSQIEVERAGLVSQRGSLAKRSRQVRRKANDGKPDLFANLIAGKLVAIDVKAKQLEDQLQLNDAVLELLKCYEQDETVRSSMTGVVSVGYRPFDKPFGGVVTP